MEQPSQPKKWKFAILVWCFIYPIITLLSETLNPLMNDYPVPLRTFITSIILVPLMAFFYIPFINKRFCKWLNK